MRWFEFATFCALALVPVAAFAEVTSHPKPTAASAAAAASSSSDPKTRETPAQKKRRVDYTAATTKKITSIVKKQKQSTEMKSLVKKHWVTAVRLLGVQRVAENTNKAAVAKKAADTLTKEDARFFTKLAELAKVAAADGGAK